MNELAERVQSLERILTVSRELTSTVALEPLLTKIIKIAAELTGSEGTSILLWDERIGELRFRAVRAASGVLSDQLVDIAVPVESSIAGAVFMDREPMIVQDAQSDPRHYKEVGLQIGRETHSLVAVPMQIKERCIGVLEAVNKSGGQEFVQSDVETLMTLGAQAAVAIENARLVNALREAKNRLKKLDQLKSDFISIASHELRTPLGLILGYAALLREQLEEDVAGPQLDVVLRAALRLKYLMETMLNLRYLETGEIEFACVTFDLREEIEDACNVYRSLVEAEDLKLTVELPDDPLLASVDREKLRVIMDNLLSNAVRFTPPGGCIWVSATERRSHVEVSVVDDGMGIPQGMLDEIFEPFEQVEDHMTRRHGGMGLGLSTVKGLVELHKGRVWADSSPEHGSRFVFVLPKNMEGETETV